MKQKLRMVTTFSGIGMQERGFFDADLFDIDVVATSDIDKDAILSYAAIHNGLDMDMIHNYDAYPSKDEMIADLIEKNIGYDYAKKTMYNWSKLATKKDETQLQRYWLAMKLSRNMGDISRIEVLPECDLLTFSFPCTDISISGKQKGLSYEDWKNGVATRSGLVWEIVRLLNVANERHSLPKYLLLENVLALISKDFIGEFERLNMLIGEFGYNVYYDTINGKDTGVPQNRPRVFAMYIHKDVDTHQFKFPKPFDSGVRIKDILEDDVDTKYYLSQKIQDNFQITDETFAKSVIGTTKPKECTRIGNRDAVYNLNGVMGSLTATDYKQPKQVLVESENKCHQLGQINIKAIDSIKCIYSTDGIAPTLTTMQGGHRQPKILDKSNNIKEISCGREGLDKVLDESEVVDKEACDCTIREPHIRDISNCIKARYDCGVERRYKQTGTAVIEHEIENDKEYWFIRKLTPSECFVLMGLKKSDCMKCYAVGASDCKLYKQAGNGIITNAIALLAEHLYKAQYNASHICTDEMMQVISGGKL